MEAGGDEGVHGVLVATEWGVVAPGGAQQTIAPTWEVTALLLASRGGGRLCVDVQPPGAPHRGVPLSREPQPRRAFPTLGKRAARGRQGSL